MVVQAPAPEDRQGWANFQQHLAWQEEVEVLKPDIVLYQQVTLRPQEDHYSSPAYDFNCTWYQVIYDAISGAISLKDAGGAASRPCHNVFTEQGIQLQPTPSDIGGLKEIVIIKYKDHRFL